MGVGLSFWWLSPSALFAVGAPLSKYTAARCRGRPAGSQISAITNSAALDAPGHVLCCECISISGWSTPQEFWAGHLLDHPPTWLYQFMFPPVVGGFRGVTSSSAPGIFCLFILVTLVGVWQCHTMVLISLPLMTSGVEYIFLCLSPFWISFFCYLPL